MGKNPGEFEPVPFEQLRGDFPALKRRRYGWPIAYLNGPAGTQVPQDVIDAMAAYYRTCNANTEGQFITSRHTDRLIRETRRQVAAFLNAASWREISFGANMTSLAFSLSHAFGRLFSPGEEVVVLLGTVFSSTAFSFHLSSSSAFT